MADFQIKTDTPSLAERRQAQRQQKQTRTIVAVALVACVAVVGLIIVTAWSGSGESAPEQQAVPKTEESPPRTAAIENSTNSPAAASQSGTDPTVDNLVPDDGQTMWVSPTQGAPLDLGWLPGGCQMVVALRPADFYSTDESEKIVAALGPLGARGQSYVESATALELAEIERLVIGVRAGRSGSLEVALVVFPVAGVEPPANNNHYAPPSSGDVFVVAQPDVLDEVKELEGSPPPLQRELESLVATSDSQRHVTLVVTPTLLFDDAGILWTDTLTGVRELLFRLLPDTTRGIALSLHWDDDFFAELRLEATLDERPEAFASRLASKIAAWPRTVQGEIAAMQISPHSRDLIARLPEMLRVLDEFQRVGTDDGQSLLRVYLPKPAGHSLLMAGELLLAERFTQGTSSQPVATSSASPRTVQQRLDQVTSLSFARDTLETAVKLLGDDIGVDVVILGSDLQLEGITKNQSFGLAEHDKPARDILVSILRLANPDKTATGPADPKQKLVYTVGTRPGSDEPAIFITTRAQAEKRQDRLPSVFVQ